jgi:hypothetical protein
MAKSGKVFLRVGESSLCGLLSRTLIAGTTYQTPRPLLGHPGGVPRSSGRGAFLRGIRASVDLTLVGHSVVCARHYVVTAGPLL